VTAVPTGPRLGVKPMIEVWEEEVRWIESRLPTASYLYVAAFPDGSMTPVRRPSSS
jgi:hypothetical protein